MDGGNSFKKSLGVVVGWEVQLVKATTQNTEARRGK